MFPEAPLSHSLVSDKVHLILEIQRGSESAATRPSQTTACSVSSEIRQLQQDPQIQTHIFF